jgi:hypothetical protein
LRLQLKRRLKAALASFLWLLCVSGTSADAVTGTFTGSASLRGNYYYERSTRVVAPALIMTLESPRGVRADATYLIDAITSASQATGVKSDVAFREIRHDVQGGLGYEIDLGNAQLDLSARGRMSREPDYHSRGFGFAAALSLDQRNTVLRLNGYFIDDSVYKVDRMAPASNPNELMAARAIFKGKLDTLSLGLAWDQVLSPLALLTLGYDLALLDGFTSNPYRIAVFQDGGGEPEHHPSQRLRHAVYGWLSHYVPATSSSLRLGYRLYHDDWNITAHAPEVRLYQEMGPYLELRLRYRYFVQGSSYFWRQGGNLRTDPYYTADPKMSPFTDQTFGFRLRLALSFLSRTPFHFFRTAVLDGSLEYMINTSRYGNGWISQAGLIWPF